MTGHKSQRKRRQKKLAQQAQQPAAPTGASPVAAAPRTTDKSATRERDDEHLMIPSGYLARRRRGLIPLLALCFVAVITGWFAPNATDGSSSMSGMNMTHYMGLLSLNQPWNLLIFMALPVVLAETLAISELALLFSSRTPRWVHHVNRAAGLLAGPVMLGIFMHLMRFAVIPMTIDGTWAGWIDVVAVLSYLAGVVPMMGVSLVHAGVLGYTDRQARKLLVIFVAVFLVVAHVAMILGMMDPTLGGWQPPHPPSHQMPDGTMMPGMHH